MNESMSCSVSVIGAGYVGLTTAACLASIGHRVSVYDIDSDKIAKLLNFEMPIFEPGLRELVANGLNTGLLKFSTDVASVTSDVELVFLCVPTPQDEDGAADLTYVLAAARECGKYVKPGAVIVTKSTVPVGSVERIRAAIAREDLYYAANPEFLREGSAISDFLNPDRIVVGSSSVQASEKLSNLYAPLEKQIFITSQESAETIKYASNAFLAMKLSFVNDLAALCEKTGSDISQVTAGMGLDSRIGDKFLSAGPGWGGSCFPKDTKALSSLAESLGVAMPLINATLESNERAHKRVVDIIQSGLGGSLEGKVVCAWGLSFKSNTDDTRESPALAVISRLQNRGAIVRAYDPHAHAPNLKVTRTETALEAAIGADALVVLTEWENFSEIPIEEVKHAMKGDFVLDTRDVLDRSHWIKYFDRFTKIGLGQ